MRMFALALAGSLLFTAPAVALEKPSPPTKEELAKYAKARATISTRYGDMVVRFFPDLAPMHVKNFIYLAEKGFYDGAPFHRVIPGFMIQGGDGQRGNGTGGPGYTINGEFSDKKHVPGILSMARTRDPNSAGSQFFIMVATKPHLDNEYSVFGELVEGLDVAEKIAGVAANRRNNRPLEKITMTVKVSY